MNFEILRKIDKDAYTLLVAEQKRQSEYINLIPSENYASHAVLEAMSSVFANKYSEGYPGARYYPGNEHVDEVERLAQERAKKLFKLSNEWFVNVQPYSGSPANMAVYFGVLGKDDSALGMELSAGGHLTHGHKASASGKFFRFVQYGVTFDGYVDYEKLDTLAKENNPKLIVAGTSAYSRILDFKRLRAIANSAGALLMVDMAHIAGLVAGGAHPSPFQYADIVTTTTHKSLRGPRGAIIFTKGKELADKINKAVFPGLQGGPHNNQTFAIAVALREAQSTSFQKYAKQIVKNARALTDTLSKRGFDVVSGGTDTHLALINLSRKGISGKQAEQWLYEAGIVVNRNAVPFDTRSPVDPSGIRLGTPAITTRGFSEKESVMVGELLSRALSNHNDIIKVKKEIFALAKKFPLPY